MRYGVPMNARHSKCDHVQRAAASKRKSTLNQDVHNLRTISKLDELAKQDSEVFQLEAILIWSKCLQPIGPAKWEAAKLSWISARPFLLPRPPLRSLLVVLCSLLACAPLALLIRCLRCISQIRMRRREGATADDGQANMSARRYDEHHRNAHSRLCLVVIRADPTPTLRLVRASPLCVAMGRRKKQLSIRVIGASDSGDTSGAGSVQSLSLDELLQSGYSDEYCNELQPLWIQVENASGSELDRIGAHFGLHPLTVEAVQTRHTREKLEIFQTYLFLVFHALHEGRKATREWNPAAATANSRRTPVAPYADADTADQSEAEIGRALPASPHRKSSHPHEGSSLLPKHDTAKYYGTHDPTAATLNASHFGPVQPSPQPPRRHKSTLSVAASAQHPSMSPSQSIVGTRAGGLTGAAATTPPTTGGKTTLAVTIPSEPAHDRFRYFPERVFMPGSPQSVNSSRRSSVATDSEDDQTDESDSDDDTSSCSSGERSTAPQSPAERQATQRQLTTDISKQLEAAELVAARSPRSDHTPEEAPISASKAAALLADREPLRTAPIKLVVFPHLVLSFHSGGLETVTSVARTLEREYNSSVESTAWIIHALLDSITDSLLPVVTGTAMEVDALEELIYVLSGSEHRDLLKRMGMTRRRLSFLRQRLWSKRDILMSLIGTDWNMFLAGVQIPYLRDVYDHVVTMLHKVEAASDMLGQLQNTYLANVQIDVAEASNDANSIMKNLAAVGAIILPLQLVASLWGMNCEVQAHTAKAGVTIPIVLLFSFSDRCLVCRSLCCSLRFPSKPSRCGTIPRW